MNAGPIVFEAVVGRENMQRAWRRVHSNRDAAGVDGLAIDQAAERLRTEWPWIRQEFLAGHYQPQPVQRVDSSMPDGGIRPRGKRSIRCRKYAPRYWHEATRRFNRHRKMAAIIYRLTDPAVQCKTVA